MIVNHSRGVGRRRRPGSSARRRTARPGVFLPLALTAGLLTPLLLLGTVALLRAESAESAAAPYALDAVLIGRTTDPRTERQSVRMVVDSAVEQARHVLLGPLETRGEATLVNLAPSGSYDVQRADNRDRNEHALQDRETQLVTAAATGSGNVLTGLHALADRLAALPVSLADVVLVGDLSRVGGDVDLRDAVQRADPGRAVAALTKAGLMPDCHGWRVHAVAAVQDDATRDDPVAALQNREFWRRFFQGCGGRLAAWDATQLIRFPASGEVQESDPATPCSLTVSLRADLLFATGEARLAPAAGAVLRRLVDSLARAHPGATARITGFTDSVGAGHYDNLGLSRRRAEAVRDWLVRAGISGSRLSVQGRGDADPVADNRDEEGRRLNRRVEITLTLAAGECR